MVRFAKLTKSLKPRLTELIGHVWKVIGTGKIFDLRNPCLVRTLRIW